MLRRAGESEGQRCLDTRFQRRVPPTQKVGVAVKCVCAVCGVRSAMCDVPDDEVRCGGAKTKGGLVNERGARLEAIKVVA